MGNPPPSTAEILNEPKTGMTPNHASQPKHPIYQPAWNELRRMVRRATSGQELVEFALVLPVLVFIAFGVLDLGRALHAAVTIENAARVGARYGNFHPDDISETSQPCNSATNIIILETCREAQNSGLPLMGTNSDVQVICPDPEGCTSGHPIRVRVTYHFPLVLGFILPSPIDIRSQAEMVIP